jgi:hypothetical protein
MFWLILWIYTDSKVGLMLLLWAFGIESCGKLCCFFPLLLFHVLLVFVFFYYVWNLRQCKWWKINESLLSWRFVTLIGTTSDTVKVFFYQKESNNSSCFFVSMEMRWDNGLCSCKMLKVNSFLSFERIL